MWGGCSASNFFSMAVNVRGGFGLIWHRRGKLDLAQAPQHRGLA